MDEKYLEKIYTRLGWILYWVVVWVAGHTFTINGQSLFR